MTLKRIETKKQAGIVIGVAGCILVVASLWAIGQDHRGGLAELWLSGQPKASLRIEVFSDYQCPHCRTFYLGTIKPLIAGFTRENRIDDIYILYHDLPLDAHQYSRKAVSYALAAERLSRDAWLRVSDILYQEQAAWAQDGNIEAVLSRVLTGSEMSRVKSLISDPAIEQSIRDEIALAQSRQVNATPTFFIVTQTGRQERVNGAVPYDLLKGHLDSYLK
jgi:protein-disulfide isomerase